MSVFCLVWFLVLFLVVCFFDCFVIFFQKQIAELKQTGKRYTSWLESQVYITRFFSSFSFIVSKSHSFYFPAYPV